MSRRTRLPQGLARRFALAAAGLAAIALLLISAASWWLISRQQHAAITELAARERNFHAAAVSSDLTAVHTRMAEMAGSSILATGLVDSVGKETYLLPFLSGVRQVNGIPVQLLFTDFEGKEIAGNPGAQFTPEQLGWLRGQLQSGRSGATITGTEADAELVAMQPLVYSRTNSPEGALLYKLRLADLRAGLALDWADKRSHPPGPAAVVSVPEDFRPLGFMVRGGAPSAAASGLLTLDPQVLPIAGIAAVLFALVVLAGARIAALLTRDVRGLENFSREVIDEGLTDRRAQEGGSTEVRSLATSVNRMLDRLQQQQRALVDEQAKLTELAVALRTANRRKDEFLAMLAHELRNPLAPISTGAQLLRVASAGNDRIARTSDIIARQAQHMAKLLDDLLDVSRVTRGLITLDRRVVDLREVVQGAVDQIQPLIAAREHALHVELPPAPMWVEGDPARLVQIASNLLNNAAKYTPAGGRIDVSLRAADGSCELRVADNGIGIDPDLMPEIFDLFTQGTRSADRALGGLGLGLALVRNLVELHGGQVRAHSEGVDRGSAFTVSLPCTQAPAEAAPVPGEPRGGHALQVLVVDDNQDAARTLADLLAVEGHEVTVCFDAASALQQAAVLQPDAYVLDIGLPDIDGNELARRLRLTPHGRRAVLVALTGYGQPADRAAARSAGFDHHLVKPVDPAQLLDILARAPVRQADTLPQA